MLGKGKSCDVTEVSRRPGWWLASDGRWYPPEDSPNATRRVDAATASRQSRSAPSVEPEDPAAPDESTQGLPSGWYEDPVGAGLRFWNGTTWTGLARPANPPGQHGESRREKPLGPFVEAADRGANAKGPDAQPTSSVIADLPPFRRSTSAETHTSGGHLALWHPGTTDPGQLQSWGASSQTDEGVLAQSSPDVLGQPPGDVSTRPSSRRVGLGVAAVAALLLIVVVLLFTTHHTSSSFTSQQQSAASAWFTNGGRTEISHIQTDLANVTTDVGNSDTADFLRACSALQVTSVRAQNGPEIPIASISTIWSRALVEFISGASQCDMMNDGHGSTLSIPSNEPILSSGYSLIVRGNADLARALSPLMMIVPSK